MANVGVGVGAGVGADVGVGVDVGVGIGADGGSVGAVVSVGEGASVAVAVGDGVGEAAPLQAAASRVSNPHITRASANILPVMGPAYLPVCLSDACPINASFVVG